MPQMNKGGKYIFGKSSLEKVEAFKSPAGDAGIFTMGAKGPLLEKSEEHEGVIPVF